MTDTGDGIFLIPEANFKKFEAAIAKLSKKCLKLTGEGLMPVVFGYEMQEVNGHEIKLFQVLLGGPAPKLNGWSFIATLDHANKEVGTLVRTVPGKTLPTLYRDRGCTCDHCSINRFRRNTYVVQNDETGETKQVGSACLKDFLGHDSPEKIAKLAEVLGWANECARGFRESQGEDRRYLNLEDYLAFVAREVRLRGYFLTRAKAREIAEDNPTNPPLSTASEAMNSMLMKYRETPTDEDVALARESLEWAQSLGEDGRELNDYEHNIKVIAASGSIEFRSTGFAASIVNCVLRNRAAQKEREVSVSRHLGQIGERLDLVLTLKSTRAISNDFGTSYLHNFQTANGDVVKGFFNKVLCGDGETIKVRATVKAHDEYRGVLQTVVNRPAVK